jgi:transposase-like protein
MEHPEMMSKEQVVSAGGRARRADPEVPAKATRRQFSAEYKRRILREAEAATEPGELGALLRREGLYSSNLVTWRRQRSRGELAALSPKRRGRKAKAVNPLTKRVAELERDKRRLQRKLEQAELLLDIQKKASQLLQIPLRSLEEDGSD